MRKRFYIEAQYVQYEDEDDANLDCEELASRLRGWGFRDVVVEDDGEV